MSPLKSRIQRSSANTFSKWAHGLCRVPSPSGFHRNVSWHRVLGLETFLVLVLLGLSSESPFQKGEGLQGHSRILEALV